MKEHENSTDRARLGNLDLIIARLPGFNAVQKAALVRQFSDEAVFLKLSREDLLAAASKQRSLNFSGTPWDLGAVAGKADSDRKLMKNLNIKYVSIRDDNYPSLLREIFDPPAVLYYRGELTESAKAVAIVGTRRPVSAPLEFAYNTSRDLAYAGVLVVSGLAIGIDETAHRGAVDACGRTVAVLGTSADEIYPARNKRLAARILDFGGAVISEYPPGTPFAKWHFPGRNRIISGLCGATLVVCAPEKSGALITADFALEQNRDLWVGADSRFKQEKRKNNGKNADVLNAGGTNACENPSGAGVFGSAGVFGKGCEKLAAEGAKIIYGTEDIFREWNIDLTIQKENPPCGTEDGLPPVIGLARELGIDL